MRRFTQLAAGLLLACVSAAALVHGARAALSQAIYWSVKYGPESGRDFRGAVRRCGLALRLYPVNYHMCEYVAERAWMVEGGGTPGLVEAAREWSSRGLALNPYRRRLNEVAARVKSVESPAGAVAMWQRFLDWDFWKPDSHAVMADLKLEAGDYEGALESVRWLEGTEYHDRMLRRVQAAWRRERRMPRPAAPVPPIGP